jgi:predicted Holliday junction resolvase-like endonuclease
MDISEKDHLTQIGNLEFRIGQLEAENKELNSLLKTDHQTMLNLDKHYKAETQRLREAIDKAARDLSKRQPCHAERVIIGELQKALEE